MQNFIENKSIAVVGNAQSLFDFQYGSDIDDHQVVIRINNSAIFYDDLNPRHSHGTKIDIWAFWEFWRTATSHHSYKTPQLEKYIYSNKYKSLNLAMTNRDIGFVYNNKEFGKDIKLQLLSEIGTPSSGICILYLLNTMNPSIVNVYGMDFKRTKTFHKAYNDVDNNRFDPFNNLNFKFEEEYAMKQFFSQERFNLKGEI